MDKGLCFLLKHRNIIATAYWILFLKPSFVIAQSQPCWHTFHALMSAKDKRPIKYVKPKLTPLYLYSLHAWYAWLLCYKIQQFFLECVIMHECNNNFAFPLHSSIYTAILNIHCFFFPLVYLSYVHLDIWITFGVCFPWMFGILVCRPLISNVRYFLNL